MAHKNRAGAGARALAAAGIAVCAVLCGLLLCNLTIIVKGTLNPDRPPSVLGVTPLVVLSGSMSGQSEGHIEVGDLIFVTRADPDTLAAGDVIAFMRGQSAVTHRITSVQTGPDGGLLFYTKGDANQAADTEPVTEDQLLGVCRGRIAKVGDFALFLQQPLGMLLFAGVPVLAFLVYDMLRRQRGSKHRQELEAEIARLRGAAGPPEGQAPRDGTP